MIGQCLRHRIIRRLGGQIDAILGGGYLHLQEKADGLRPFRYSIVVENCRRDFYFSEKLIDCLVTGTVPIYWGCPSIAVFLDAGGIIPFQSIRQLRRILDGIGIDDYQRRLGAIQRNFLLGCAYSTPEQFVWTALSDLFPSHAMPS